MKPKRRVFRLASRMPKWKKTMARAMARNMTMPERILWSRLKDKKLGVRFYKQKPLLGYIADFWCACGCNGKGLVIECDGPTHLTQKSYDANRDIVLLQHGILTMRFTAQEIVNNTNAVVALINDKMRKRMA